ncbi:MAG: SIMPL domain-containing protein [Micromonosporaceae bacterium]
MSEPAEGVLVAGRGRVFLTPDVLVARFGAEVTAAAAQQALSRCSTVIAAMGEVLRRGEVAERDRQSAGSSLHQAHDHQGRPRGWTASVELTARLRDLERAGDLISLVIDAGGNDARLRAATLDLDTSSARYEAARAEARALAFSDAKAAASQYAELSDRRLGVVVMVREAGDAPLPYPMAAPMFAAGGYAGGGSGGVPPGGPPVEQGELQVATTVQVRWELLS